LIYLIRKQREKLFHDLRYLEGMSTPIGPTEVGDEINLIIAQAMKKCLQVLLQAKIDTDRKIRMLDSLVCENFSEEYSMFCSNYADPFIFRERPKLFDCEPYVAIPEDSDNPFIVNAIIKTKERDSILKTLTMPKGIFNYFYRINEKKE
jgi:hypothetical protein